MGADIIGPFGTIGFFLTVVGYAGVLVRAYPSFPVMLGMIMLCCGYGCLMVASMMKKKEYFGAQEGTTASTLKKVGYTLLFVFFTLIHLFPSLTFTVRYYDIFAAVGYGLALLSKFYPGIPVAVPYSIIAIYYILGSYQKLSEESWVDMMQLISRTILAIFYGVGSVTNVFA